MSKSCEPSPSIADPDWTVRQVVPRSDWNATTETCPACGDSVDLLEDHYQVELDRERTPGRSEKLTRERRLLAFCDAECADWWLGEASDR